VRRIGVAQCAALDIKDEDLAVLGREGDDAAVWALQRSTGEGISVGRPGKGRPLYARATYKLDR
jgi:hypothetical protein